MLQCMAGCLMKCIPHARPPFSNTSWNHTEVGKRDCAMHAVETDEDIRTVLDEARRSDRHVRVMGSGHASADILFDAADVLISLHAYSSASSSDYEYDPEDGTVWANAGWRLRQLMQTLRADDPLLYLETNPSGDAFTLGGCVSTPVHGSTVGAGLFAESLTELRVIEFERGAVRHVSGAQLREYRCCLGLKGVITHVRLRLHRAKLPLRTTSVATQFRARDVVARLREEICESQTQHTRLHLFWNVHNGRAVVNTCRETGGEDPSVAQSTHNEMRYVSRGSEALAVSLPSWLSSDLALAAIQHMAQTNDADGDTMYLETCMRHGHLLASFIPVVDDDWDSVERALKRSQDVCIAHGLASLPMDLRLVRGSEGALLSPISSSTHAHVTWWVALEVFAPDIAPDIASGARRVNPAYALLESAWKNSGGVPHFGKCFGVAPDGVVNASMASAIATVSDCDLSTMRASARDKLARALVLRTETPKPAVQANVALL